MAEKKKRYWTSAGLEERNPDNIKRVMERCDLPDGTKAMTEREYVEKTRRRATLPDSIVVVMPDNSGYFASEDEAFSIYD